MISKIKIQMIKKSIKNQNHQENETMKKLNRRTMPKMQISVKLKNHSPTHTAILLIPPNNILLELKCQKNVCMQPISMCFQMSHITPIILTKLHLPIISAHFPIIFLILLASHRATLLVENLTLKVKSVGLHNHSFNQIVVKVIN